MITTSDCMEILGALYDIGKRALGACQEEDFAGHLARSLGDHVACDVVIVSLCDDHFLQGTAVYSSRGEVFDTYVDPNREFQCADELLQRFPNGIYLDDICTAPYVAPGLRYQAIQSCMTSGFMVPLSRNGQALGVLVFGWSDHCRLTVESQQYLRELGNFAGLMADLFLLQHTQRFDSPTGFLTRVGFERQWSAWLDSRPGALLYLKCGNVREDGTAHDRAMGDDALHIVARVLRQVCDSCTLISRYSETDFVVLFRGDLESAEILRSDIRTAVKVEEALGEVTVSEAVAVLPDDGRELDHLIDKALRSLPKMRCRRDPVGNERDTVTFTQEALASALAEAAELHEGGSRIHLVRIREFTRLVANAAADIFDELEDQDFRGSIIEASILHDIGKMAIPQSLLNKPGKLSPEEYNLIKTHTVVGQRLLQSPALRSKTGGSPSLFLNTAANIARSHHERWDGTGYPDGLVGETIPLEARIVAICDVYDALRSRRTYKESWSHRAALDYIKAEAGRQFDPKLVEVFSGLDDKIAQAWITYDEPRDDWRS